MRRILTCAIGMGAALAAVSVLLAAAARAGAALDDPPTRLPAATHLSTSINGILSASGDSLLVSDQISEVVQEYGADTEISGIPAGSIELAQVPAVQLQKTVGLHTETCTMNDTLTVPVGTLVKYCYQIRNTGPITLTRHTLVDNRLGTILNDFSRTLAPGASVIVTQSTMLMTTTMNSATWTAFNPGPTDVVSATSVATVTAVPASVSLAKTVGANPTLHAMSDTLTVTVGTLVTYRYEIRNTGPITLTRHTLVDNRIGTILNNVSYPLPPGEGVFLTHSVVITMTTVNTATWTAFNPGPVNTTSSTDQARVVVLRKVYLPVVGR